MHTTENNEERLWRRADELARSGKYLSWCSIETELRYEGLLQTRRLLDDQVRRDRLDKMCREARRAQLSA